MSCVLFDEKLFQIKEEISDEEKENDENTGYLFSEDIFFVEMLKKCATNFYLIDFFTFTQIFDSGIPHPNLVHFCVQKTKYVPMFGLFKKKD